MLTPREISQYREREKKLLREGTFHKIKSEYHGFPMSPQAEREWRQKIDDVYTFFNK